MSDGERPQLWKSAGAVGLADRLPECLLVFALFGYPPISLAISLLGVSSRFVSVPYRVAVAAMCLAVLGRPRLGRMNGYLILFIVLGIAYGVRLAADAMGPGNEAAVYALQFFLIATFLPTFALLACGRLDQLSVAVLAHYVTGTTCILLLIASRSGLLGAEDITDATGRLSTTALDPITIGHIGGVCLLTGLVAFRSFSLNERRVSVCLMLFAGYSMVMSGAKGPAGAALGCMVLWAIARRKYKVLALFGLALTALVLGLGSDGALLQRFQGLGNDPSTAQRVELFISGWAQMFLNPMFGTTPFELSTGYYPHNVFLETGMAIGVPALLVLLALAAIAGIEALRRLRSPSSDLLALFFLQATVMSLTSAAAFAFPQLWLTFGLLLSMRGAWGNQVAPHD